MALQSQLFRNDPRLQSCLISDPAHLVRGAQGDHVMKVQAALVDVDNAAIDSHELSARVYGPSTAAAVLAYKQKRNIVNPDYQSKPDDIVGKMTIAALDKDLVGNQGTRPPAGRLWCSRRS